MTEGCEERREGESPAGRRAQEVCVCRERLKSNRRQIRDQPLLYPLASDEIRTDKFEKSFEPGFVNVLSDTSQTAFQESDAHEACTHTMHCSASARAGDHYTTTTARPPPLRHARAHTPRRPCTHLCMDAFWQASRTRATPAEVHLGHEHTRCTTTRPRPSPPSSRRPR